MRSSGIARAGQAGGFRRDGFGGTRIKRSQQWFAAELARDAHEGAKIVGSRAGDARPTPAAVAVAIEHTAFVVDRDLVKIQQVAIVMAATLLPDAGHALDGIIRGSVDRLPCGS